MWNDASDINYVQPRPAAENAEDCWMEVVEDGVDVVTRFECPWLYNRMGDDPGEPMSVVATSRYEMIPYDLDR